MGGSRLGVVKQNVKESKPSFDFSSGYIYIYIRGKKQYISHTSNIPKMLCTNGW